jgi:hypothetical protein
MRVAIAKLIELHLIELAERVQILTPQAGVKTGRVRQVEHRITHGPELDALKFRRQEAAAPQTIVEWLAAASRARGNHDDESGKVARFAAQAIHQP